MNFLEAKAGVTEWQDSEEEAGKDTLGLAAEGEGTNLGRNILWNQRGGKEQTIVSQLDITQHIP